MVQVDLFSGFNLHSAETLDCIYYAARHLQMFNYDLICRHPGERELCTIGVNFMMGTRASTLTPNAESKASFHGSSFNFTFTHSLKSGTEVV